MSSGTRRGFAVLPVYAVLGWAYCGLLIAIGRRFLPMHQILLLHTVGAPLGFALLAIDETLPRSQASWHRSSPSAG